MSIAPGSRLGPYEIIAALGQGGMGAVYRARDPKLNRDVAIKVLLPSVANDPERLARFKREAQVLAALNHPHIAHIYGLEDVQSGTTGAFLVMELVEGSTLADRIANGPIAHDEALPIARQIAEALKAAHEQGIIHRDLKPANIKVRPDGTVKVLDFGLAKLIEGPAEAGHYAHSTVTQSPTITSPAMTRAGMILGTAAYMSPEQAKGRPVDKSCDVWAFACVVYEMLTGHRAFRGEDVAETLANVLKSDPAWELLPAGTPDNIVTLVHRCLAKDRQLRITDIAVAQFLLENSRAALPPSTGAPERVANRRIGLTAASVFVAVSALAGVAWIASRPAKAPPARTATRYRIVPPSTVTALINPAGNASGDILAWSADGRRLVYAARTASSNANWGLFRRSSDELDSVPIQGAESTAAGNSPFFSPDGEWVGFLDTDGKLLKIPYGGGKALVVSDLASENFFGATWLPDGSIVFASDSPALMRVPASGGTPSPLTKPDGKTEISHRWPEMLPGGNFVLFVIERPGADFNGAAIAVLNLKTGQESVILEGGTAPHYLPSGHLSFVRNSTMLAAPFDLGTLRVTGPAVPVLDDVYEIAPSGAAKLAVASGTGTVAYISGTSLRRIRSLVWVDRHGVVVPLPLAAQTYETPRLSPDGQRLAVAVNNAISGGDRNIWLYQFERGTLSRVTSEKQEAETPAWTPDGARLTYVAARGSNRLLIAKRLDGDGAEEVLATTDRHLHAGSWSANNTAFVLGSPNRPDAGVWLLEKREAWQLRSFFKTPYQVRGPQLSPDGRWLAFASNENDRFEIYLQAFPNSKGRYQVSTDGGTEVMWSKRSTELFFRSADKMMAVSLDAKADTPKIGRPEMLFRGNFETANEAWYDVSADGRFMMIEPVDNQTTVGSIIVVQDWMDIVKNLVAAKH